MAIDKGYNLLITDAGHQRRSHDVKMAFGKSYKPVRIDAVSLTPFGLVLFLFLQSAISALPTLASIQF